MVVVGPTTVDAGEAAVDVAAVVVVTGTVVLGRVVFGRAVLGSVVLGRAAFFRKTPEVCVMESEDFEPPHDASTVAATTTPMSKLLFFIFILRSSFQ
jgi:hypothetical protein